MHVGESRASVPWIGLFAFGQMRRLDRLADVKPAFQCDDFGPDMTAEASALLESVIGSESGHHVLVCGNEDPEGFPWNLRPGINEGDRFHSDGSSPNSVRSAVISTLAVSASGLASPANVRVPVRSQGILRRSAS